ncbi:MAG: ABC transporter substrate-binding protein [Clostridia bacterium]|nr:ABC transporter substrate-binding protein [Clostridia bacterium]
MRNIKKTAVVALMLVVSLVFTGCTTFDNFKGEFFEKAEKEDSIIIGVLEPQSGPDAQFGKEEIQGIEFAAKMYPEVLGKKVKLVYEDTQSSIYAVESATKELLEFKPVLILGCYGDANTLTAAKYIEEAQIPAISISSSNHLITDNHHFYASVTFNDTVQGDSLGKYVGKNLKARKVAVFRQQDDDNTLEVTNNFIKNAEKYNGTDVVTQQYFKVEDTDYTPYLQQILKKRATVMFCPIGVKSADVLFTQVENMRMTDITFVGTNGWYNDDFIKMMRKHPKIKVIVASEFAGEKADSKAAERFLDEYRAEYGEYQVPSQRMALAYDAYVLAINSIEKAGTTYGKAIIDEILATKDFTGVTGNISMDKNGRASKPIIINTFEDGKFVSIDTVKQDKQKDKKVKKTKKKGKKKKWKKKS